MKGIILGLLCLCAGCTNNFVIICKTNNLHRNIGHQGIETKGSSLADVFRDVQQAPETELGIPLPGKK